MAHWRNNSQTDCEQLIGVRDEAHEFQSDRTNFYCSLKGDFAFALEAHKHANLYKNVIRDSQPNNLTVIGTNQTRVWSTMLRSEACRVDQVRSRAISTRPATSFHSWLQFNKCAFTSRFRLLSPFFCFLRHWIRGAVHQRAVQTEGTAARQFPFPSLRECLQYKATRYKANRRQMWKRST